MKASKFSIEKLLRVLVLIQNGVTVKEACGRENISTTTFYSWKRILHIVLLLQKESFYKQQSVVKTSGKKRKAKKLSDEKGNIPDKPQYINDEEKALLDLLIEIIVDIILHDNI